MSNITVLTEYKIDEAKRNEFLSLVSELKSELNKLDAEEISVFEGIDQPNLFVEEYLIKDKVAYDKMRQVRNSPSSSYWKDFNQCIIGKVNVWAFEKRNLI